MSIAGIGPAADPRTGAGARRSARRLGLLPLARAGAIWLARVRRWLGIRRGVRAEGVYYKELASESLTRALSKKGAGFKDYRVTFADRRKMMIRCTPEHVFADLMGPVGIDRLEPLLGSVRPGGRVLEFDAGTGYRAYWLSFVVGPAGGVVAIATRPDHAEFASLRYSRPNVAFETADGFALAGEVDGAFDAVVALTLPEDGEQRATLIGELWRLTAPGGVLLVGLGADADAGVEMEVRAITDAEEAAVKITRRDRRGKAEVDARVMRTAEDRKD